MDRINHIIKIHHTYHTLLSFHHVCGGRRPGAVPGFEKGGDATGFFLANLGDFLKQLAQKGVGVRLPTPGSAPDAD